MSRAIGGARWKTVSRIGGRTDDILVPLAFQLCGRALSTRDPAHVFRRGAHLITLTGGQTRAARELRASIAAQNVGRSGFDTGDFGATTGKGAVRGIAVAIRPFVHSNTPQLMHDADRWRHWPPHPHQSENFLGMCV